MYTRGSMTASQRLGLTLACVAGVALTPPMVRAAAALKVLRFTIDETLIDGAVFSDGKGQYVDYRLTSGLNTDTNYCIDAAVDASGGTFIRLNRKLDGETGTQYCGLFGGAPRQFKLTITNESVCNELHPLATPDQHAPCSVTGSDKPRIRLDKVYASKPSTTPVSFLILSYDDSVNYVVRTDAEATVSILFNDTNQRAVTYAGTARVWQGKNTVGVGAFSLPFHIDFVRTSP